MNGEITDADLHLAGIRGEIAKIHTAIPGVIVSYDSTTQTATVQIAVKGKFRDATTDAIQHYDVPPIPGVPVQFPSASGFSLTFPLSPGDPVLLVFAERSLDGWKANGATGQEPADIRRFDVSDAVAIPGSCSPAAPIPAAGIHPTAAVLRGAAVKLGSSSATDPVALKSLVEAQLTVLSAAISAAPVVPNDGGATFKAALIAALAGWPGNTGATKTTAE